MAGIKGRVKRAHREAQAEGIVLKLCDGGTQVFDDLTCWKEMFLVQYDLFKGEARDSEVLEAVRAATPESRRAFEAEYGSIEKEAYIVEGGFEGAWVREHRLLADGTVETTFYEGGSEEAERIRTEIRQQGSAF